MNIVGILHMYAHTYNDQTYMEASKYVQYIAIDSTMVLIYSLLISFPVIFVSKNCFSILI